MMTNHIRATTPCGLGLPIDATGEMFPWAIGIRGKKMLSAHVKNTHRMRTVPSGQSEIQNKAGVPRIALEFPAPRKKKKTFRPPEERFFDVVGRVAKASQHPKSSLSLPQGH